MVENRWCITKLGLSLSCLLFCIPALADSITRTVTTTKSIFGNSDPNLPLVGRNLLVPGNVATSSSQTTMLEQPFMGRPNYEHRLELLREQMDNAMSRGWLSDLDANVLNKQYSDILSQLRVAKEHGFPIDEANALERQLNLFNMQLADMSK